MFHPENIEYSRWINWQWAAGEIGATWTLASMMFLFGVFVFEYIWAILIFDQKDRMLWSFCSNQILTIWTSSHAKVFVRLLQITVLISLWTPNLHELDFE